MTLAQYVKQQAAALGFDACGIARATAVSPEARSRYERWIEQGMNAGMEWAARNGDVRSDPQLLLEGARSVIVVALNYYPRVLQEPGAAQLAYYAYGQDYHTVVKEKLWQLGSALEGRASCRWRACVDTAPLRERYWAQQAGLGFIGDNNQLIIPGRGSYFFLGALLTTHELDPDEPCPGSCSSCGACRKACPTGALQPDRRVDARRCLSYLTIEHCGDLPQWAPQVMGNRVYGCDECQKCCPHNARAQGNTTPQFQPRPELLTLTAHDIMDMTPEDFSRLFSRSAVKRVKLHQLQRNAHAIIMGKNQSKSVDIHK